MERGGLRCSQPLPPPLVADRDRVVRPPHGQHERPFADADPRHVRHVAPEGWAPIRTRYPTRPMLPNRAARPAGPASASIFVALRWTVVPELVVRQTSVPMDASEMEAE